MFKLGLFALMLLSAISRTAFADSSLLNDLAGSWNDLDTFVTMGACAAAPSSAGAYLCSPAQLPFVKTPRFEMAGFISATESSLNLADTLRKQEIDTTDINIIFNSYNYSEVLLSTRVSYVAPGVFFGIRPFKLQGQFQLHNPNLPLGSLTYRNDLEAFAEFGHAFKWGDFNFSLGGTGTIVKRTEVLSEATLIQFASEPPAELLQTQNRFGLFADLAAYAELPGYFTTSIMVQDLGQFETGQNVSSQYLYVLPDHVERVLTAFAFTPSLWVGTLQVGIESVTFFNLQNDFANQLIGTLSYYVGPLRVLSGFRPGLFRTGLALRLNNFEVSVAQEWYNSLQTGQNAQPSFTLEASIGL
jgi:hypothetical protein